MQRPAPALAPRAWLAVLVLVGGAACARVRTYAPPMSGPVARLRIATDGVVHLVPGRPCVDLGAPGAGLGPVDPSEPLVNGAMNERRLAMAPSSVPVRAGPTTSEVAVRAGEPLLVAYAKSHALYFAKGEWRRWTCRAFFRFTRGRAWTTRPRPPPRRHRRWPATCSCSPWATRRVGTPSRRPSTTASSGSAAGLTAPRGAEKVPRDQSME